MKDTVCVAVAPVFEFIQIHLMSDVSEPPVDRLTYALSILVGDPCLQIGQGVYAACMDISQFFQELNMERETFSGAPTNIHRNLNNCYVFIGDTDNNPVLIPAYKRNQAAYGWTITAFMVCAQEINEFVIYAKKNESPTSF